MHNYTKNELIRELMNRCDVDGICLDTEMSLDMFVKLGEMKAGEHITVQGDGDLWFCYGWVPACGKLTWDVVKLRSGYGVSKRR